MNNINEGYIYLILTQEITPTRAKIGISTDPYRRFDMLQAGSPLKLRLCMLLKVTDTDWEENKLHRMFQHLHIHSEWFYYSDDMEDEFIRLGGEHINITTNIKNKSFRK